MDVIDILMAKMLSGSGVDPEQISSAVTDWLEENVDPVGSAVVVDSSLSIEGAAADAKVTGDAIAAVKPSDTAKTLLITILRNALYKTDQSANITALETAIDAPADNITLANGVLTILALANDPVQSGAALTIS